MMFELGVLRKIVLMLLDNGVDCVRDDKGTIRLTSDDGANYEIKIRRIS